MQRSIFIIITYAAVTTAAVLVLTSSSAHSLALNGQFVSGRLRFYFVFFFACYLSLAPSLSGIESFTPVIIKKISFPACCLSTRSFDPCGDDASLAVSPLRPDSRYRSGSALQLQTIIRVASSVNIYQFTNTFSGTTEPVPLALRLLAQGNHRALMF